MEVDNWDNLLSSSSSNVRVPFLSGLLTTQVDDPVQLRALAVKLLKTYHYYQDHKSRSLVTKNLINFAQQDPALVPAYTKFVLQVADSQKTVAMTSLLTLLDWCNEFIKLTVTTPDLIKAQALVLVKILDQQEEELLPAGKRARVFETSLAQVRASIINVTDKDVKSCSTYIDTALQLPVPLALALIGVLAQASLLAIPTNPQFHDLVKQRSNEIISFYNKDVLASKKLTGATLSIFQSFISEFVSESQFTDTVLPHLEKAALRSSELAFGTVTPVLFQDLGPVSALSQSKLITQLLSALKASKETTVQGAMCTLQLIIAQNDSTIHAALVAEIAKSLKMASSADHKASYAQLLSYIPRSDTSAQISQLLATYVTKDQNETSLRAFLEAFVPHWIHVADSSLSKMVCDGLKEKKLHLRKHWYLALGQLALTLQEFDTAIWKEIVVCMKDTVLETVASPLAVITARGIESAYVSLVVLDLVKSKNQELAPVIDAYKIWDTVSTAEPCIVRSKRVYAKLTSNDEKSWFGKAVFASVAYTEEVAGDVLLYLTLSRSVPYDQKLLNLKALAEVHSTVATACIAALNEFASQNDDEEDLSWGFVPYLVNVLTQSADSESQKQSYIAQVIVVCHLVKVKGGWVGVAQRAGIDPGAVVATLGEDLVTELVAKLLNDVSKEYYQAIVDSLVTLAFISPAVVAPLLGKYIAEDVNVGRVQDLDETKVAIWKATDLDEPVVDVLNQGKHTEINKNTRDYETRKWEESVRKDLQAKKSNSKPLKKLSKDELASVKEQLSREAVIRASVDSDYHHLKRGVSIISGLAHVDSGVDNGRSHWYPLAVSALLGVLKYHTTLQRLAQLKSGATESFLALSNSLSSRLGSTALFLGVATLRVFEIPVADEYTEEPLLELVSRVLFRVKFVSVQRPLDSVSLMYILPLLSEVLQIGKAKAIKNANKITNKNSEFVEEDPQEEQLLLAVEIVSTHAEEFQDEAIPRYEILEVLLSLLSLPAKAKLAKECLNTLCQHISVNISSTDLSLILAHCIKPEVFVRTTVLEVLDAEFELSAFMQYSNEIWIAVHDNVPSNAELAATIWEESQFQLTEDSPSLLLQTYLGVRDGGIRLSVSKAIATAVTHLSEQDDTMFARVLDELISLYETKAKPPAPVLDAFGLVIKTSGDIRDPWEERSGVALTLKNLAHKFTTEDAVSKVFEFFTSGETAALGDKEQLVRQELQDAGVAIIEQNGVQFIETLISIFEQVLSAKDQGSKTQDNIKESVIILYGSLARHLQASDPRLEKVVDQLVKTLDTPSEDVQFAVSECIAPLVKKFEPRVRSLLDGLFEKLFDSDKLATRRGAAYGIAGLVKGLGIQSLANYDVIRNLMEASEDKKNAKRREGVSFAIECLSQSLGKFFEPYIIEVLPIILKQLGDSNAEVREATDYATRVIMKNTTSYGVKQLIPLAIQNLDEIAWRTKRGSVDLLGSMAYLDPTQLSSSLSTIVPEIVAVLNDSHKEVRKSADAALKRFGDVIRNPEIQSLVPTLIKAIGDPTKYTDDALDALIKTQFVHYIDGPSLALIIHVIHRGMHERSASTKRKACQIVGNMAILVDSKDLLTYLPELVQELEVSMVDPVPSTRATAARALGSLVEKLGEDQFPDLIPRLLRTLQDEEKAGDRLGSAQALSEIISALGTSKLEEMLPTILANASSSRSYVRAGFMPLLLFLPVCFGMQFSTYLDRVIPVILEGLAAEEEIRETALKAARLIVKNYATKAVDLLLPELERGLSDLSYRIRLSSVELTGDLLFQITGISGKLEAQDDDDQQVELSGVASTLLQILGQERRDRVLAALFVCRQDVSGLVRNATVDIWKALVANTPRTVKEILPTLTTIIIRHLASSDETQRHIAAQTLGEMVKRVSNALPSLLPTLEEQLVSSDSDAKQGICIAVRELIESSPVETVKEYQPSFVSIVRDALVDSNEGVREAAASAFDILQDVIGDAAVDEVIPQLLNMLSSDADSENALLALQDIMSTKSDVIFPILIPSLLSPPINAFNARALASLAEVAGKALYKRLSTIISAFVDRLLIENDENDEIKSSFDDILLSVNTDDGLHPLLQQLLALIKHEDVKKRSIILARLPPFFKNTALDYSIYTQDIVTHCIMTLDDTDMELVTSAFNTLNELVKRQSKESLEKLVKPARQALAITGVPGSDLSGFTLPKGPNCVLPIFLHGLMYGNPDQRESSALGIADIVEKTPAANLKPFVTVIVGPLIRVIGERFSGDVKAAILYALNMLFAKIPQFLRPFIPQLQRTFVKSLSDPSNETLRSRAAKALGTLIEFQPRVDPLVAELVGGAKQATDGGVRTAMLKALLEVVNKAGSKMNESSKTSVMNLVEEEMVNADEKMAVAYARLVGSLSKILTHDEAIKVLRAKVLNADLDGSDSGKFAVLTLNAFLRDAPSHVFETGLVEEIGDFINKSCESASAYVSDNGVVAAGKFLLLQNETKSPFSEKAPAGFEIPEEVVGGLIKTLSQVMCKPVSTSLDSRRLALVSIRTIARFKFEEAIKPHIELLAPSVFACVRDIIIPIKLAAEKAYLAIFNLVEDTKLDFFHSWFDQLSGTNLIVPTGQSIQLRSIGDYTKRVAVRLATVERERIAAGGDAEAMFSDRYEDETEIWAVGGVELSSA